jgi:predicted aspartyl protease
VLAQRGPILQVTVSIAQILAVQLLQQGISLPAPVSGHALIDTGATATCIDDAVAGQLQLPVIDIVQVASASHASTRQNVYPAQIELGGTGITIDARRAIGAPLASQGLIVLIGRDVLQQCTLFYNGPAGAFTIAI